MTLDGFWNERPMEARLSPPRYMSTFILGEMELLKVVMASWMARMGIELGIEA